MEPREIKMKLANWIILFFAREATPRGPYKDGPGEINILITYGGIVINPEDIIAGDIDGVVVIPPKYAKEILIKTKQKCEKEQEILAKLKAVKPRDKSWVDKDLKEKGYEFKNKSLFMYTNNRYKQ